ncbi:MAG: hypothetical protein A2534_02950 [Candidatus Magasanikbacteria bacterium RIFOXYD2_FULL_39_9]|uniref:Uncharacterized protein n=1 Tax=Candidatus Magasanikbacteria bacterium RIFOXYD1_FULL_40_23 TaxID=1798705 RepID=A0A1F6P7Z4_9BACT|nr:MAG: hypothetical protein A2534_02950 [Candidatus Magasanikbacteria bacterium RIFOXYD2_FULL_39_9]OGH92301.1 MAG: hypothetical protein A2563_04940 [Candidatus Magasanikbacteria bacterium RIFOXYD1_FULL_40_23]
MRVHFIFALALSLGACGSNSHNINDSSVTGANVGTSDKDNHKTDAPVDFRFPIYLVPDDNFWSGCSDPSTIFGESCRADRVSELESGVEQWLAYFPLADRPVIMVVEKENLPADVTNLQIIDLYLDDSRCKGVDIPPCFTLWACYEHSPEDIVFMKDEYITSQVVAHELGHAFGLPHTEWLNEGCASPIMTTPVQSKFVTDLDMQLLCRKHPEISCPISPGSWQGTLIDTVSCVKYREPKQESENTCK